jgi:hypothetical protein
MADATPTYPDASNDPRWVKFNGPGLKCSCGETHVGLIALSMLRPAGFPATVAVEPNVALRTDGNFISNDYCVWEGKFFAIRMSMPMMIQGAPPPALLLSVWASVDEPSFKAYIAAVNGATLNLNGSDGKPSANPIINEQRNGITLDRLFDIYAANNHDMRPSF